MPTYAEIVQLPETQRLVATATLLQQVAGDTEAASKALLQMQVSTNEEIAARWRPLLERGVQEVQAAAQVLTEARELMQARSKGWVTTQPGKSLIRALVDVATSLTQFVELVEAAGIEVQARDLFVRVRGSTLNQLPTHRRSALLQASLQGALDG